MNILPIAKHLPLDPRVALRVIRRPASKREHNRYCGPAVVAALTGLDTGAAARAIREANDRRSVVGVNTYEMDRVLACLGFKRRWYTDRQATDAVPGRWPKGGLTFLRWLRESERLRHEHRALVVAVGNHWIAVAGGHYVDNHAGTPRPVESYPHPRARVRLAIGVGLP